MTRFDDLLKTGGDALPTLYPISVLLALLLVLAADRLLATRHRVLLPQKMRDVLDKAAYRIAVPNAEMQSIADEYATRTPFALVLQSVARAAGREFLEVRAVAKDALDLAAAAVRKPIRWIDTVYATSTLFGLLASVVGLISAFAAQARDADANINNGIAVALVGTGAGVALAVLAKLLAEALYQRAMARVGQFETKLQPLVDLLAAPRRDGGANKKE